MRRHLKLMQGIKKQTRQHLAEQFHAVRRERLKDFKDGYAVRFNINKPLHCPVCLEHPVLVLDYVIVSTWPYIHGDYNLKCPDCGYVALFGIPEDPVVGMELIIWDSNPAEALTRAQQLPTPRCPFHSNKPMQITKVFGDLISGPDKIRVQWKCPHWFLTEHVTVPRIANPKEKSSV